MMARSRFLALQRWVIVGGCWPMVCCSQSLRFGERDLVVTIAARPEFISKRRSNLPEVVLAFCLVLVVVLVGLLVVGVVILQARARTKEQRRLAEEKHRIMLAEASKQAHERTIAYACHQLRCVARTLPTECTPLSAPYDVCQAASCAAMLRTGTRCTPWQERHGS